MSVRVGRAPGGHLGPAPGRAEAAPRKHSTDAAGQPRRRSSAGYHEHEATCPMHTDERGAAAARPGGARGRMKSTGSPGPRTGAAARRAAPTSGTAPAAKGAPAKPVPQRGREAPRRPSSVDNRPEWNSSPPEIPRRTSSGNPNRPVKADKSPARRNSPAKQAAGTKPAAPQRTGIPKRKSVGSSISDNKPNKAKNAGGTRDVSNNSRSGKALPSSAKREDRAVPNGTNDRKDRLSVPNDRPRSGSITGAGKSELGKFLEKLHLEEMYGSSDDEPDRAKSRLSIESVDTWRTGDGDEEAMNTLRTKHREKEPSISPSWKFADVVIPKNTEDRDVTKPKQKNRFSFLVDSTDEDEPHTKPVNGTDMNNGLSRFDDFVRDSLSPERSKPSMPVSRKKSEPVSERIARPSTAAQSGSARRGQARSRSRSQDRDLRKGSAKGDGSRRASYLDDLIQPSAPRAKVPSASQPREKRSSAPQMDQHARPKATKPTVPPKFNSRSAKESERRPENNRYSHSRTPSPEKSPDIRKQSLTRNKETPPRRASTHTPGNYSINQQDVKRAHQRRSRSPSPNTADILERYHDAYPDDAAAISSPFAEDWSSRRSSRYSRDKTSPLSRDLQSPKISSQNGRVGSLSEAPKGDYYSPTTAVQLRERRADEPPDDKRVKRKSLSLAGMSNPERISTDDDGDRLRRLIMSTEALERRFFTP